MEFDSKEELYISWWLDELKEKGYVDRWEKCKAYPLAEKKLVDGITLREHIYTPDFEVWWTGPGAVIFCAGNKPIMHAEAGHRSIIEVKGGWDAQNMTRLFKINQKWMYNSFGIYVQLIKPEELFKKTFCPERYRLTDGGKAQRKLKTEYLTLDEYIQQYNTKDDRKGVQRNRSRKLQ